ncbi:MAG: gliding motility-associated C-terminal domain-containing protein, partial [Cyclonatronaceae bacterium]
SLSVNEDNIFLAAPDSSVIDSVFYSADWHNPNLADTRGIALERINPFGESNESENWGSSVLPEGGTPGAENSLFATPSAPPETRGLVMEPNPFSPDGDGRDDHLFINYRLDEADYLLRVRIFDRYGRLVRTLADGRAAGLEGSLSWDGRRDNGQENRVGIYIILFEAYNSSAGSRQSFRESVVLARQL